jgi:hypothetical protein
VHGGELDENTPQLARFAIAAEFYEMPLFGYIRHYRAIRREFGIAAAQLDLAFAVELRETKAQKAHSERMKNGEL